MLNILKLTNELSKLDTTEYPDFYRYESPVEMALWVLWVVKEKLGIKQLSSEQISTIIRELKEMTIAPKSITNSFNRAGNKIHIYQTDKEVYYEVMKPGKDYLLSRTKSGSIEAFYFDPDKRFTSKRFLSKNILSNLTGELKIVDPYSGERTLDILKDATTRQIKFLTRTANLRERERTRFLRELQDFKPEKPNIEFRDYPNRDIHDRYIISSDYLVIMGHSFKDLGSKESFAIILNKDASRNIIEALIENFNRRWHQSTIL